MIKHKPFVTAIVLAGALASSVANTGRISIEIGDQPYFRGGTYWNNDWEMIWVPGHWSHHHHGWIHGYYIRGQHHRSQKNDNWQDDRDRHDNHQFDDAHRHHRPPGSRG